MTTSRGTLMAKIRGGVSVYKFTAVYVCLMLTLILVALVTGWTIE